jgi:uncharacterized cupin superfamily protein
MSYVTKFRMLRDINGYNGFGLPFSNRKYSAKLTADTAQSLTVPSDEPEYIAIFSFEPGDPVWVSRNETVAIPAGAMGATTSELNPVAREVRAGDVLQFKTSAADVEIGITLYALQ